MQIRNFFKGFLMKKLAAIAFWIAGFALLIALVAHQGFAQIGAALAQVRWGLYRRLFVLPGGAAGRYLLLATPLSARRPAAGVDALLVALDLRRHQ